ncbi:MAG: NIPSNAP family protein, partial [Acidobacteriaceae bacterium]|nr:NIPSNAP family protein [Acidobacteriaceae bacterium]
MSRILFASACLVTLMTMTNASAQSIPDQAPSPSLIKSGKVYELRTYHAYPGKLEDLHKRFRDHTLTIFARHGMKVVGFWGPTDQAGGSENTLIYILEFPSREAAIASWKAFHD